MHHAYEQGLGTYQNYDQHDASKTQEGGGNTAIEARRNQDASPSNKRSALYRIDRPNLVPEQTNQGKCG